MHVFHSYCRFHIGLENEYNVYFIHSISVETCLDFCIFYLEIVLLSLCSTSADVVGYFTIFHLRWTFGLFFGFSMWYLAIRHHYHITWLLAVVIYIGQQKRPKWQMAITSTQCENISFSPIELQILFIQ